MPEEVRFFGRLSVYGLVVGVVYWMASYEVAGTVLLLAFGVATGTAFVALRRGRPRRPDGASAPTEAGAAGAPPDGPFGDESGPVPMRSGAPLLVGFGVATVALAGVFGPWFAVVGLAPLVAGAVDWLRAAVRELDLRSSADQAARSKADQAPR